MEPFEITGVPTKTKAESIAKVMRTLFPTWKVKIIGSSAPYTVRRTPPSPASVTSSPLTSGAAIPVVSDAKRSGALGFLDFIAKYESTGNYNARFGSAANTTNPQFTLMTVDQVLDWQKGRKFSACGKYQIIRATLTELKSSMALNGSEQYDADLQDRMGLKLLERRGLSKFLDGSMAKEDFALSVAREWAALPGVKEPFGERSVYAGDGVNQAHVGVAEYLSAIDALRS